MVLNFKEKRFSNSSVQSVAANPTVPSSTLALAVVIIQKEKERKKEKLSDRFVCIRVLMSVDVLKRVDYGNYVLSIVSLEPNTPQIPLFFCFWSSYF